MREQCVVVAVLSAMRENGNAVCIGSGIATNDAGSGINRIVLDVCEAFPESHRAGLIGEGAGGVSISARQIGLAFEDCVTWHDVQLKRFGVGRVIVESIDNFIDSRLSIICRIDRPAWIE